MISAVYVAERENVIVNRLNKTKVVREVDHEQERVERIKKEKASSAYGILNRYQRMCTHQNRTSAH